jgi:hypothetical protein
MALVDAIQSLNRFALAHVHDGDVDEQIEVYLALAETLPDPIQREAARKLSLSVSETAALQLELHLTLKGKLDGN